MSHLFRQLFGKAGPIDTKAQQPESKDRPQRDISVIHPPIVQRRARNLPTENPNVAPGNEVTPDSKLSKRPEIRVTPAKRPACDLHDAQGRSQKRVRTDQADSEARIKDIEPNDLRETPQELVLIPDEPIPKTLFNEGEAVRLPGLG